MWIRPRIFPSRCGLPTSDTFPVSGAAHRPSQDCIHLPWLLNWADWELAEQTQLVGDVRGDEEGAAILLPWVLKCQA